MSRRRALLRLDPEAIVDLLKQSLDGYRFKIPERALPDDARFLAVHQSIDRDCLMIVVESEEFEDIEPCRILPVLDDPVIETTSDPHEMEIWLWILLKEILPDFAQQMADHGLEATVEDAKDRLNIMKEFVADHEDKE